MKDYKVTTKEYVDYLTVLRNGVYKILPLYEENNEYLETYINDSINKLIYLKEVVSELDDGFWYVDLCCELESLHDLISTIRHSELRRKVLYMTNLITSEIKECESR